MIACDISSTIDEDTLERIHNGIVALADDGYDADLILKRVESAADSLGFPPGHLIRQGFMEAAQAMAYEAVERAEKRRAASAMRSAGYARAVLVDLLPRE